MLRFAFERDEGRKRERSTGEGEAVVNGRELSRSLSLLVSAAFQRVRKLQESRREWQIEVKEEKREVVSDFDSPFLFCFVFL